MSQPIGHNVSMINELAAETQPNINIKNGGHKRRGPIWKYFLEDETDRSFAFCTTCQKRLSRGKTGNPASKCYIGSMRHHLNTHKEMLKDFMDFKVSAQTGSIPKSIVELNEPVANQNREEIKDSLGPVVEYFENNSTTSLVEDTKTIKLHMVTG